MQKLQLESSTLTSGADFLCYVTPAEHLGLPTVEDVSLGVIASKVAAHAADIVKLGKKAIKRDIELSKARSALNWGAQIMLSIDPDKAKETYHRVKAGAGHALCAGTAVRIGY